MLAAGRRPVEATYRPMLARILLWSSPNSWKEFWGWPRRRSHPPLSRGDGVAHARTKVPPSSRDDTNVPQNPRLAQSGLLCAWVCGCVGAWVRGCVGVWVRGCVGAWVRGCVGAGVRECGSARVHKCTRAHVWMRARRHACEAGGRAGQARAGRPPLPPPPTRATFRPHTRRPRSPAGSQTQMTRSAWSTY